MLSRTFVGIPPCRESRLLRRHFVPTAYRHPDRLQALILVEGGSIGVPVESLGELRPSATAAEAPWGIELRPVHPTSREALTITVNDTWQAMPPLLGLGTQWVKLPVEYPHGWGDRVAFATTAHTDPVSATSVNGIPTVTVAVTGIAGDIGRLRAERPEADLAVRYTAIYRHTDPGHGVASSGTERAVDTPRPVRCP